MAAPQLDLAPVPAAETIVSLSLDPWSSHGDRQARLTLCMAITNREATTVRLRQLVLGCGSPAANVAISLDLTLGVGATVVWTFATNDNVLLPQLALGTLTLRLYADPFDEPVRATLLRGRPGSGAPDDPLPIGELGRAVRSSWAVGKPRPLDATM